MSKNNIFIPLLIYKFGNVLNLQISGNVSSEVLDRLQIMMAVPTHIEQTSTISKELIRAKLEQSSTGQQQIKNVLEEVNDIQEKVGTEIKEIKAGDVQISRTELSSKEIILKGNEH